MNTAESERENVLNDSKALLADQYKKNKKISETERLEYFGRLDHAIDDSEHKKKLVDIDFEDVFENDDIEDGHHVESTDPKALKKKNRHHQTNEDLKFDLMLMDNDARIFKLVGEKTERLEEEKNMIELEIFRLKSIVKTNGIDFNLEEVENEDDAEKNSAMETEPKAVDEGRVLVEDTLSKIPHDDDKGVEGEEEKVFRNGPTDIDDDVINEGQETTTSTVEIATAFTKPASDLNSGTPMKKEEEEEENASMWGSQEDGASE
jgi:hypothetical protein